LAVNNRFVSNANCHLNAFQIKSVTLNLCVRNLLIYVVMSHVTRASKVVNFNNCVVLIRIYTRYIQFFLSNLRFIFFIYDPKKLLT